MENKDAIITAITKAKGRKSLYHFTRVRNLPAIAHFDSLLSSYNINPHFAGERRSEAKEVNYDEYLITINAHLRIPDSMIAAACTQEQFRAYLDRHVFFWPTIKDCQKMLDSYTRREPDEGFAILQFDAYSLLLEHYSAVKLSKYDSGSAPRFPKHCSYKKSPEMFLPLNGFKRIMNNTVPTKASEIREVLIEDQVIKLSKYLRSVYVDNCNVVPECWRDLAKPQARIANSS
ncbi:hypothetical protein Back11_10680 [Paenibacillus baekrokdamisoli]|uniref:Uncharacterized protein n=1 Tax=Paenibacillus baekrokdamisoli TaxID=1712516 RepID=A0A3G9J4R3_9BACL|nr:hypothetical protein [Paenibacillus baekrokdamisoli]MBB3067085.1 hypothetical protein [Paenibacillus baekrokdamisoli]BBH19723.1 hypothetical protein Back11_10680 [Paenibacillus baekrokdamisoli]